MMPFQRWQMDFGRHLRAPNAHHRPRATAARPTRIYAGLLFNNLCGFLDACFPVSRSLLGVRRWRRLCRAFFIQWRSPTPYFREIPREFVRFLESKPSILTVLPPYLVALAHYEWAELAVEVMDVDAQALAYEPNGDLLTGRPLLQPALMNLQYDWPVHRVAPRRQVAPAATCLLVFRDDADKVRFAEVNPATAALVELLRSGRLSGEQALLALAEQMQHPQPRQLVEFGATLLMQLREQGVVLGVAPG